jgi:hypothetical protein
MLLNVSDIDHKRLFTHFSFRLKISNFDVNTASHKGIGSTLYTVLEPAVVSKISWKTKEIKPQENSWKNMNLGQQMAMIALQTCKHRPLTKYGRRSPEKFETNFLNGRKRGLNNSTK